MHHIDQFSFVTNCPNRHPSHTRLLLILPPLITTPPFIAKSSVRRASMSSVSGQFNHRLRFGRVNPLTLSRFVNSRYACKCCCHSLLLSVFCSSKHRFQSASHCQSSKFIVSICFIIPSFIRPLYPFYRIVFRILWSPFHSGWKVEETRILHTSSHR